MAERRVCEHCHAELSLKWGQGFCPFCGRSILPLRMVESADQAAATWVKPKQRKLNGPKKRKRMVPTHEQPLGKHEKTARNPWLWQTREVAKEKPPKIGRRERLANLRTSAENSTAPILLFVSPFLLLLQNLFTLGLRCQHWFRFNEASLEKVAREETLLPRGVYRLWCCLLYGYLGCVSGMAWECFLAAWDFSAVAKSVLLKPAVFCFFASWLIFRYMLFWMRWIILENIFNNLVDIKGARSLKPFAPAALLLWFFGSIYMQFHINRLIWAGVFRPVLRDKTRQREEKRAKASKKEAAELKKEPTGA